MESFILSDLPIDPVRLRDQLENHEAGALVAFEGRVRRHNADREVIRLDYEAFGPLALKEGTRIMEEAHRRFPIVSALCVHRTGTLELGDLAVWVGVISRHRSAGFDACRMIIDEVKQRVPIWKKEHYADGDSGWIQSESGPSR